MGALMRRRAAKGVGHFEPAPTGVVLGGPRRSRVKTIAQYVPIFISVLALASSIFSAYETRRHNRLSAMPFVQFYRAGDALGNEVGLYIDNTGLGPAVIKDMRMYLDGTRIKTYDDISSATLDLFKATSPSWEHDGLFDFVIPPTNRAKLYFTTPSNVVDMTAFRDLLRRRIFVIVRACSIYSDCTFVCSTVDDPYCAAEEHRLASAPGAVSRPVGDHDP